MTVLLWTRMRVLLPMTITVHCCLLCLLSLRWCRAGACGDSVCCMEQDKKELLRKAVEGITMAQCTFQPQTNQGHVRQLLHSILHEPESMR